MDYGMIDLMVVN